MADDGVFIKNADIAVKAGANVNATAITVAETDKYVLNVEAFINIASRYNWSDAFATLNVDVAEFLTDIGAALCAIYAIEYDMSGFSSRAEAESMIVVLRDSALRGLQFLRDKKTQDFINGA